MEKGINDRRFDRFAVAVHGGEPTEALYHVYIRDARTGQPIEQIAEFVTHKEACRLVVNDDVAIGARGGVQ